MLKYGEKDTDGNNFLNYKEASLSGYKYEYHTGNGTNDGAHRGWSGCTSNPYKDDNVNGTTTTADGTTDANHDGVIDAADKGYYEFTGLAPGNYSDRKSVV